MKAMILAAGFGTRLLPFTETLPKPCFPILNTPLIIQIINNLRASGIKEVVINLHHLSEKVKQVVNALKPQDVTVHFSFEDDILGTAGGIKKVQSLLQNDTFILHNGDILSNVNIAQAVCLHKEKNSAATMIVKAGDHTSFIGLDGSGKIVRFPYGKLKGTENYSLKTYFTGIHILEPTVFNYIPPSVFYNINSSVYPNMQADGYNTYGYVTDAYWYDIGTPQDFLSANFQLLDRTTNSSNNTQLIGSTITKPVLIGADTTIKKGCTIGPYTILGNKCVIEEGCSIIRSVVLEGAIVKRGSVIENTIVGFK